MKRLFRLFWPPYPLVTIGACVGVLVFKYLFEPRLGDSVPLIAYLAAFLFAALGVSGFHRWRESKRGGKKDGQD